MIQLFADGADPHSLPTQVDGYTTNPSLMRKQGVSDYEKWARDFAESVYPLPISFEVLGSSPEQMLPEAHCMARWGENVWVKVPIIDPLGYPTVALVRELALEGVQVNVTCVLTVRQAIGAAFALEEGPESFLSVFAGRIADTGRDPSPIGTLERTANVKLLWASAREVLNIKHAQDAGFDVITLSPELLNKHFALQGKDLAEYSRETVQQFTADAAYIAA